MKLDRRTLLTAGGAYLATCGACARSTGWKPGRRLDSLLDAHAHMLPERPGAGANHYPMAAEALEALGHEEAIEPAWVQGAALYEGHAGRVAAIDADDSSPLGDYERFGDWLDLFRRSLDTDPWEAVVARWAPRLAPGISAAAFHGVIRTGHAVRSLRNQATAARRNELAVGLAYWAARYAALPTARNDAAEMNLRETLTGLEHPWLDDRTDVEFAAVVDRLNERAIAPPVELEQAEIAPRAMLDLIVQEAATAFLEMLVLERNRMWLLHTVTGPAAVEWLLPELDDAGARAIVAYSQQAVVAMYAAYGEPYTPRAHVRETLTPWPDLIRRAVNSQSVHGIKLIDALVRFDRDGDAIWRSIAEQWFEWT